MRRVLVVNPGADVYGSDLQLLESLEAFRAAGWPTLVVMPEDGPLVGVLRDRGVPFLIKPFPVVRRSALSPRGFSRLVADVAGTLPSMTGLLRLLAPDVLYVNTMTIPWWLVAARAARVRSVVHLHEAENADPRWVRAALNGPVGFANRVIVNSECARDAAVEAWPLLRGKITRVYNGVPDRPAPPVPPLPSGPFRVATASRLSPRKGVHIAVEAVELLRQEGRDVVLEIAGSPFPGYEWYVDELRAQADRPALRGAVTFNGYVSPIWPVFDRAHAVLFPSLLDSFGNAVVEAQLSERPVVATAAMGHLETVAHEVTGLHVPVGDAGALARAVARVMDDPELSRSLGKAGRARAVREFGVERYGDQMRAVIEQVSRPRT